MNSRKQKGMSRKPSLVNRFIMAAIMLMVLAGAGMAWLTYDTLIGMKKTDGWALSFLEWENRAFLVGQRLRDVAVAQAGRQDVDNVTKPEFLARWDGQKADIVSGALVKIKPAIMRGLWRAGRQYALHAIEGRTYILSAISYDMVEHYFPGRFPFATYVAGWGVKASDLIPAQNLGKMVKAYVVSQQGLLVYSSSAQISPANIGARPPVQKYLKQILKKGSFEFKDKQGKAWVSFYGPIPDTNLILFAEMPRNHMVVRPVMSRLGQWGMAFLGGMGILFGALLMLRVRFNADLNRLVSRVLTTSPGDDDPELQDLHFEETAHVGRAWMHSKSHYLGILTRISRRSPVVTEMEITTEPTAATGNKDAS